MPDMDRRKFLAQAAAVGATAAVFTTSPARGIVGLTPAAGASGAALADFAGKRHVAILGGGCGGLSAAHELIERGFTVDIYERYPVAGGKCRSIPSPGTGSGGRADLPGEHGFRFFPGYYRHVIDTMSRIPYGSNRNGVKDNLVFGEQARFSRRDALDIPFPYKKLNSVNPFTDLTQALIGLLGVIPGLGVNEIAYFATRLTEFVTSSDARRDNQYDKISWFDFVRAERFGPLYQNLLTRSLTRNLVAAQAELASTRTIGLQATRILVSNIVFSMYDEASRLLNGPTTEAWIDPWLAYLRNRGVRWFPDTTVEGLGVQGGAIAGARVRTGGQARTVTADVYVLAIPVEGARQVIGPQIRGLDPALAGMDDLMPDWMTGVQYFLSRSLPIAKGHVTYVDSPWALTSISQGQFWSRDLSTWRRPGAGHRLGRRLQLERGRDPLRQDRPAVHPGGDPQRDLGADEDLARRGRHHPARQRRRAPLPRPGDPLRSQRDAGRQRRAAAGQHGGLVGQAPARRHQGPQPVPRVRLREDHH